MEPWAVFENGRLHFAVLVAALLALRSELADLPDLSLPGNLASSSANSCFFSHLAKLR